MRDIFSLLFFAADSAFCFVFFCLWLWFSPFVSLLFLFCFRSYCFVLFINVVLLKMCVLVVYAWILLAPVTLQFVCFILFLRFCYVFFFSSGKCIIFFVRFIVLQILLRLSKVMRMSVWCVCLYVCVGERQCGLFDWNTFDETWSLFVYKQIWFCECFRRDCFSSIICMP